MIYIIILSTVSLYYVIISKKLLQKKIELEHNIKVLQLEIDSYKIHNIKYKKEIYEMRKRLQDIKNNIK